MHVQKENNKRLFFWFYILLTSPIICADQSSPEVLGGTQSAVISAFHCVICLKITFTSVLQLQHFSKEKNMKTFSCTILINDPPQMINNHCVSFME